MPDEKSKRGGPDRSQVSAEEQYEVAEKHGLSQAEARRIIEQAGPSRENADTAAEKVAPGDSSEDADPDDGPGEGDGSFEGRSWIG